MRWLSLLALAAVLGGCSSEVFVCQHDSGCGADGTCEGTGYCSFPDETCASGRRYGDHAANGLAGECVNPGSDEAMGTGHETGSTAAESSGDEACDADACVPVPAGWSGPVTTHLGVGESAADCEPAGTQLDLLLADAAADPAECGCSCDVASLECDEGFTRIDFGDEACVPGSGFNLLLPGDCEAVNAATVTAGSGMESSGASGTCTPVASVVLPAAQWATQLRVCDARASGGSCPGDETCASDPGLGLTCIHRDGDVACPGDGFIDRHLVYRDSADARVCTACTCGSPQASCGREVVLYDGDCEAGTELGSLTRAAECLASADATSVGLRVRITGGCEPSAPDPLGEVTPQDPVTVCCRTGSGA